MQRIEVITGEPRRRSWTVEEKLRILAEAEDPDSTVADVARRHDLHNNQIYSWRRSYAEGQLGKKAARRACFAAVEVVPGPLTEHAPIEPGGVACKSPGNHYDRFEVILVNDRRVLVAADFDADALKRLVLLLEAL